MTDKERESLQKQLETHQANLRTLNEKAAKFGIDIPLSLINEISDEEAKVQRIESRLNAEKTVFSNISEEQPQSLSRIRYYVSRYRVFAIVLIIILLLTLLTINLNIRSLVSAQSTKKILVISSKEFWYITDIFVNKGDIITVIESEGNGWTVGGTYLHVNGEGYDDIKTIYNPMPDVNVGTLLGRVGNGTPFKVGKSKKIESSDSGWLQFQINDAGNLQDNDGSLTIEIVIN